MVHHKHQLLTRRIPRRGGPLPMQKHCSVKTRVHLQSKDSSLPAPRAARLRAQQVPGHELHQPLVEEPPCGRKTARVARLSSAGPGPVRRPSLSARCARPGPPTRVLPVEAAALLPSAAQLLGAHDEEPVAEDGFVHGLRAEAQRLGGRRVSPGCPGPDRQTGGGRPEPGRTAPAGRTRPPSSHL